MNALSLLIVNLRRKRVRTLLTLGSFIIAFFLFGLLSIIHNAFYQGAEVAGVDRLIVRNKISLTMFLPLAYKEKLLKIPGIRQVTFATWFGGVYQSERNFFPQYAIETETYRGVFPEYDLPMDQWKAFAADRQGCVVGQTLAERFNWKIGDRIPLKGTIFPGTWEFNIRGIYRGKRSSDDTTQFWLHYPYLEERTEIVKGLVGAYFLKIDNPDNAPGISQAVDGGFRNSAFETTTETERAFAAGFMKQFGNIRLIILLIGGVVFFTLILITGTNMAMSIRERTYEIGIMKTLGWTDGRILLMILSESIFMAATGGGLGLGLAKVFSLRGDPTGGMLLMFHLDAGSLVYGMMGALLIGLAAGIVPALQSMRLRIVDALGKI